MNEDIIEGEVNEELGGEKEEPLAPNEESDTETFGDPE